MRDAAAATKWKSLRRSQGRSGVSKSRLKTETAAFLTVTNDKLVERRIVVDEGLFRDVCDAMGRSANTTEMG
jgi:hypothetical protein